MPKFFIKLFFIISLLLNVNLSFSQKSDLCDDGVILFLSPRFQNLNQAIDQNDLATFRVKEIHLNLEDSVSDLSYGHIHGLKGIKVFILFEELMSQNLWAKEYFEYFIKNMKAFNNQFYVALEVLNYAEDREYIQIKFDNYMSLLKKRSELKGDLFREKVDQSKIAEHQNETSNKNFSTRIKLEEGGLNQYHNVFLYLNQFINKIKIGSIVGSKYFETQHLLNLGMMEVHPLFRKNGIQDFLFYQFLKRFPELEEIQTSLLMTNKYIFLSWLLHYLSLDQKIVIDETINDLDFIEKKDEITVLQSFSLEKLENLSFVYCTGIPRFELEPYVIKAFSKTPLFATLQKYNFTKICHINFELEKNFQTHTSLRVDFGVCLPTKKSLF